MISDLHVVIFVRAPQIGAVKRRLAAEIGTFGAWRFYRSETARLVAELQRNHRYQLRLAVTPDGFAETGRFWPRAIPRVPQGLGDLGSRMARALQETPRGPVVIVGSDTPGLTARHIEAAFKSLQRHDAVLGPAFDGGYWLIGFRRRPPPLGHWWPRLFRDVRWSQSSALEDTVRTLPAGFRIAYLESLRDVDTAEDLRELGGSRLLGRHG